MIAYRLSGSAVKHEELFVTDVQEIQQVLDTMKASKFSKARLFDTVLFISKVEMPDEEWNSMPELSVSQVLGAPENG